MMNRKLVTDTKEIEELNNTLYEYNHKQPVYQKWHETAYKYYDDNGNLIGGIVFTIRGEWLEVDTLLVFDEYRGKGFGKCMMNDVEQEAISKGCTKSLLDTRNYQAPEFYQKLGYKIVFTQEFKEKQANVNWMVKDLV